MYFVHFEPGVAGALQRSNGITTEQGKSPLPLYAELVNAEVQGGRWSTKGTDMDTPDVAVAVDVHISKTRLCPDLCP